jgi:MEMO1 family protein
MRWRPPACAPLLSGVGPLRFRSMSPISRAAGVLTPHIDYQRGGPLYGATWMAAVPAVASAEVVVAFGTDHNGSAGRLTPTRQRYATPWGALPTDTLAVDALASALGDDLAYDEELHHRREHSIELAAVWLHWALRQSGRSDTALPPLIPVLCGSFHRYVQQAPRPDLGYGAVPESEVRLAQALDALRCAVAGRRALVVSAADLAHVGPAFGDVAPLDDPAKLALASSDAALLSPALRGDAGGFLAAVRAGADRTRICGLPPTYWALRLLEQLEATPTGGRLVGYRQCPADDGFGSVVSIAGVLWEP